MFKAVKSLKYLPNELIPPKINKNLPATAAQ